jgi:O-antigen ligase
VPIVCSAFVSSTLTDLLGLQTARMATFSGLVLALLTLAVAHRPDAATPHDTAGLWLLLLLSLILALDLPGGVDPLEYKILLPVLVVLAGPRLALLLDGQDLARLVWWLLSLYVATTALAYLVVDPDTVRRGAAALARWDVTGSVVSHAGLCAIHLVLAATVARVAPNRRTKALAILLGAAALVMILLSGTRTVLVMLTLYATARLATAPSPARALRGALIAALLLALATALYSLLWSDAFLTRLLFERDDYTSGRWASILYWLRLAGDAPMGLGFGAIRATLANGRPALDGEQLLEWPHDELIRFWVEAGPIGLLFILTLVGTLMARARRIALAPASPLQAALALALAADMLAESLFQNFFNGIYEATAFALILVAMSPAAAPRPQAAAMATG